MQIPGGDLAPARRRRYGGSYGRRRRLRTALLVLLALAVAAAAVGFVLTRDPAPPPAKTARQCPTPSPTPIVAALPEPRQIRLVLLNGTSRNGLAKSVKAELVARGFAQINEGNAPAALPGPSQVTYGTGGLPAATVISWHVLGSVTVSDPTAPANQVQVTLGSDYRRLASPAEVAAATPIQLPAPSASPCV